MAKETYGGEQGKFIARQVFKFSYFGSNERPLSTSQAAHNHYAIVTYWRSFNAPERSHANDVLKKKFVKLATMCPETKALGYDMLWQGAAGWQYHKDAIFSPCE